MTTKSINTTKSTSTKGKTIMAKSNKKSIIADENVQLSVPTDEINTVPVRDELDDIINDVQATIAQNEAVTQETIKIKKTALAQKVFDDEVEKAGGNPPRSATIKRMMEECNLTKQGASTYFQNMKKAAGFVTARV